MPKRILVTGANGQLGRELQELVSSVNNGDDLFFFTDKESLDITNAVLFLDYIDTYRIDTIINCAAYTAVDKAEEDHTMADAINHQAVKMMAEVAKKRAIMMIHISTDYVFNGENYRPYTEDDPVMPQGIYGETKLKGEQALIEIAPNAMIIRTSWVYSEFGQNFVKTMLRLGKERDSLGVIFDQVGTPTYARDLAEALLNILHHPHKSERVEVYHYSNEGVASWYDFAKAIFEFSGVVCKVNPINTEAYPTPAKRPHYSVLDKSKIKDTYDLVIPYWRDALKQCISRLS